MLYEIECGNEVTVVIWIRNTTQTQISSNDMAILYIYTLRDVNIKWISWFISSSKV